MHTNTAPALVLALGVAVTLAACKPAAAPNDGMGGDRAPDGEAQKPAVDAQEQNAGHGSGLAGKDQADQPVQVIGTYLACAVDERASTGASIGCLALRRGSKKRVDLKRAAARADWRYSVASGTPGAVQTVPQAYGDKWHVVYVLTADSPQALAALMTGLRIQLDVTPLPGQQLSSSTHFEAPLPSIVAGADDLLADAKGDGKGDGKSDGKGAAPDQVWVPPPPPQTPAKPLPGPTTAPWVQDAPPASVPGNGAPPADTGTAGPVTTAPATTAPAVTAPSPYPVLAGQQFTAGCKPVAGGSGYANKYLFFGEESGQRTVGRVIQYYDTACAGLPTRVQKSVPEVTFYYFVGDTPVDGAIAVSYSSVSTKLSFYIRMDGDAADSKVEVTSGL